MVLIAPSLCRYVAQIHLHLFTRTNHKSLKKIPNELISIVIVIMNIKASLVILAVVN